MGGGADNHSARSPGFRVHSPPKGRSLVRPNFRHQPGFFIETGSGVGRSGVENIGHRFAAAGTAELQDSFGYNHPLAADQARAIPNFGRGNLQVGTNSPRFRSEEHTSE